MPEFSPDLQELMTAHYLNLNDSERFKVQLSLCQKALAYWEKQVRLEGPLSYVEGVVGTYQKVDLNLPADALTSVRSKRDTASVQKRYLEPLSALQDDDLEWSGPVTLAFYAIYNAFCLHVLNRNIDKMLIIKQALAIVPESERLKFLNEAIHQSSV